MVHIKDSAVDHTYVPSHSWLTEKRMKTCIVLALALSFCLASLSHARDSVNKRYPEFVEESSAFAAADDRLDEVWEKVKATIPPDQYEALLKEQMKWNDRRYDETSVMEAAAGADLSLPDIYAIHTNRRADELERRYLNASDAAPDAGRQNTRQETEERSMQRESKIPESFLQYDWKGEVNRRSRTEPGPWNDNLKASASLWNSELIRRSYIAHNANTPEPQNTNTFAGKWKLSRKDSSYIEDPSQPVHVIRHKTGELDITELSEDLFYFEFDGTNENYGGSIEGTATITASNKALFDPPDYDCIAIVKFERTKNILKISSENEYCLHFGRLVTMEGTYVRAKPQ